MYELYAARSRFDALPRILRLFLETEEIVYGV